VASLVLGTRRGRLPGSALVRAATLFGFAEGTTRVALSRMVAAGELSTSGGEYSLDGPLLDRHGRQEEGRRPQVRRWDGSWRVAVVGSAGARRPAAERAAVRRRLADLRLAEWREGVWIRPDNFRRDAYPSIDGCTWLERSQFVSDEDVPELVDKLWSPAHWAATATELLAAMTKTTPADDIAETFRIAAAVVRHLRDDPLLPEALLPAGWPGQALRAAYDDYEGAFSATLGSILG
jgi:phenylacetic acid degradation operon negative regulatory protein